MALLHGLQYCVSQNFATIYDEYDSQALVPLLYKNGPFPWQFLDIFHDIASILSSLRFYLRHIFREENSLAHFLERYAGSSRSSSSFSARTLPTFAKGATRLDHATVPNL